MLDGDTWLALPSDSRPGRNLSWELIKSPRDGYKAALFHHQDVGDCTARSTWCWRVDRSLRWSRYGASDHCR